MIDFIREAAHVRPEERQLAWYDLGFYAFIHFGMNTFTDREWGDGQEPEALFNPTNLDCDQWVDAIKSAGMKGMVLTAKHHDGFCLWPSKYTSHSVANAPVKRDIVKEASEACRRGGIKFGFYLSPWDRNSALYGTDAYNDYFCDQLTELLTEYGDIFCVWFDNACGEGPNGKRQTYDFDRYISLIRKYQPNAVIFNDYGQDVRWCGNEAGKVRNAEWAVVPWETCRYSRIQTGPGPMAEEGDLSFMYNTNQQIGTMNNILYSKGLVFAPAEINTSIRPGWFWHENEEPKSLERLFYTYLGSVGGNGCLHLNLPPTREGRIDERDVKRLKELGEVLDRELGHPIPARVQKLNTGSPTQPEYLVEFDRALGDCHFMVLREDIAQGQRVESFLIASQQPTWLRNPFYQGTTIGNRKICPLGDPFAWQNPLTRDLDGRTDRLIVKITSARDEVLMKSIEVY
ncbi:MAG: alpha-L-fucosidase [Lachnospiraceae bacterium]|nr:alpha-L-fucosidase [Lachnospiraceae bacterium]